MASDESQLPAKSATATSSSGGGHGGGTSALAVAGITSKPLRSFLIDDILSYKPKKKDTTESTTTAGSGGIVRPWDTDGPTGTASTISGAMSVPGLLSRSWPVGNAGALDFSHVKRDFGRPRSADDDESLDVSDTSEGCDSPGSSRSNATVHHKPGVGSMSSPLDALFHMTSKTLEGLNQAEKIDPTGDHLMFSNRQPPKKKRKSRTAFTNHQIFELEKRFLYQKYLSPADRDELASTLGLTGAQVITWFQNRRAKLKRDMEELKKDLQATKMGEFPPCPYNYK